MILVSWSIMYVFYIIFFSLMALIAAGFLISFLVRRVRREYPRVKPAARKPFANGTRPAYG